MSSVMKRLTALEGFKFSSLPFDFKGQIEVLYCAVNSLLRLEHLVASDILYSRDL